MSIDHTSQGGLDTDLAELRRVLARLPFPARQDDVLAALVRRRSPSRLLWRAGSLSPTRRYHSIDEVCAEVAQPSDGGSPPPPGW
jgi:hypothetical protein